MKLFELIKKFNMFIVCILMIVAVVLLIKIFLTVPGQCSYVMENPMQYYEQETGETCICQVRIPMKYNYSTSEDYEKIFEDSINNS